MERSKNAEWEVNNSIGILRLSNPPENYLTEPEFAGVDFIKSRIRDEKIKGMIICGAGRHFSGGARLDDLFRLANDRDKMTREIDKGKALLDYIEFLDIPVVAAIRGACFGAGLEIALAAHLRVCSEKALFAFPESNNSMIPGLGGTRRLSEKASFPQTLKMILNGDMIDVLEAREMNIPDYIVPDNEVFDFSFSLLRRMTEGKSLKVIQYVMRALIHSKYLSLPEAMHEETRMFCDLASEEAERRTLIQDN
jgi:enoyl-CoA hydratase/carnithine racemase